MPLLPPKEQTTTRAVALAGRSLLKNEGALAWKMFWLKGNPAAVKLFNIITCLQDYERVRLQVAMGPLPVRLFSYFCSGISWLW